MCERDLLTEFFFESYPTRTANVTSKEMPPVLSLRQMAFFLTESDSTLKKYSISKKKVPQSEQRFKSYSLSRMRIFLYKSFYGKCVFHEIFQRYVHHNSFFVTYIRNGEPEMCSPSQTTYKVYTPSYFTLYSTLYSFSPK